MTETATLVSIIIPLYNKEQYFKRCFDSVVNQTYKNIECIIVEDCSTDNSLELANRLISAYKGNVRFLLARHNENGGLSAARNTGVNNSNGEYVYFLDSDDEITENCIFSLVTLVEKYTNVDIVQGNICKYPRNEKHYYELNGKISEYTKGNLKIKKNYYNRLPVIACNKLIRKDFIIQNNLYFKNRLIHEDNHWRFFMFKKIDSLAITNEYCYVQHVVPDSIMTNTNLFPSINSSLEIIEDMLCNLDADLLSLQLREIRGLLNLQRNRILSDKKYFSLMTKHKFLQMKLPKTSFFILFPIQWLWSGGVELARKIRWKFHKSVK